MLRRSFVPSVDRWSQVGSLLLAATAAWVLMSATSAQAAVVTVGSPLTASFTPGSFVGNDSTLVNFGLPEPGATVTSPVTGTIIRWRITQATGGPFRLRVLAPNGGTSYTGAGTSSPEAPMTTATQTFTANLPISAGQLIGLDQTMPAEIGVAGVAGASWGYWDPPLADGEPRAGSTGSSDTELGFNADVATKSSNAFSFGKLDRNTKKGTATLAVNVPGPGTLDLTGKGVKAASAAGAVAATTVSGPGAVELLIRTKGKKKKQLNKKGKTKVNVSVAYTPSGDLPGDPNTQSRRVKLIKHH